jgi:transposase
MTATWRTREELMHQAVTLSAQGVSRRALGRALGVSRNTVRALLKEHDRAREEPHTALPTPPARAPRASPVDVFESRIVGLLAQYPDITMQRVFETLREEGFTGGYTAIKKRMRKLRPKKRPTPSLVTPEYTSGEMAENDWSPWEVKYANGTKEKIQGFSYVLVVSRRKYFDVFRQADLFALMDGHVATFDRFEGLAAQCKYDSQKPVVLRWEGQQPIYNPRFLAFAVHYRFRPVAVRRGHPNDKPRVERSFWEAVRSFFNGRSFAGFDDVRTQMRRWLDTIVDHRRRDGSTAIERFSLEREHLVPRPAHPYDTARVVYRVASIDGFVPWDGNHYAVPYDHITDLLPVRVTQRELFVYAADLSCIARHELAPKGAGKRLDPAGLHPPPQRRSALDLDQLRAAFEQMGERAATFFRVMSAGPPRIWGFQARQILMLRERFDTNDLDAALGHAAVYGATDARAVERIVAAHASPRTLDEYVAEETAQRLADVLGVVRTPPRDLTEYDRLPGAHSPPRTSSAQPKETTRCPSDPPSPQSTEPTTPSAPRPSSAPTEMKSSSDCDDTSPSSD